MTDGVVTLTILIFQKLRVLLWFSLEGPSAEPVDDIKFSGLHVLFVEIPKNIFCNSSSLPVVRVFFSEGELTQ